MMLNDKQSDINNDNDTSINEDVPTIRHMVMPFDRTIKTYKAIRC